MSRPNGTPAARIDRLERTIAPAPCDVCKGQRLAIVYDAEPMLVSPCPMCGREIRVVHIITDNRGPQ